MASENNHIEIVKLLLEADANTDIQDNSGWTALNYAMEYFNNTDQPIYLEVVKLLLAAGANVNHIFSDGPSFENHTTLMMAIFRYQSIEIVRLLLAAGADVNGMTIHRETALMDASWKGHIEIVKLLLAAGADVNVQDYTGLTALNHARGREDIIRLLKEAGATE